VLVLDGDGGDEKYQKYSLWNNHPYHIDIIVPTGGESSAKGLIAPACPACGTKEDFPIEAHFCRPGFDDVKHLGYFTSRPTCAFCHAPIPYEVPCPNPNCQAIININDPDLRVCEECGNRILTGYGRSPSVLNESKNRPELTQTIPVQVTGATPPIKHSPVSTDQRLINLVQEQAPSRPSASTTKQPEVRPVAPAFSDVAVQKGRKTPYIVAAVLGGVFLGVVGVLVVVALVTNRGGTSNGAAPLQQGQIAIPAGNTAEPAATGLPVRQSSPPVGTPAAMNAAQQAPLPQEQTRLANSSASRPESHSSPPPPPRPPEPTSEDIAKRDQFIETAEAALAAVQAGEWKDAGDKINSAVAARRSVPEIAVNSQVRDLERQIQDNRTVVMVHLSEEKQMAANQEKQYNLAEQYFQDQRFPESKTALKLLLADATLSDDLRQKAQTLLDQVNAEILKRMQVTTSGKGTTHTVR
jgi:hypothetical protein